MTAFSLTLTPRRARVHRAIDGDYVSVARRAEAAPYWTSTARAGIARRPEAAPSRASSARGGGGGRTRRGRGALPAQARQSFTKRDFRIAASRVASASLRLLAVATISRSAGSPGKDSGSGAGAGPPGWW